MIAALSLIGLLMLTVGTPKAAAAQDTSVTVSWLNDHSSAAQYQPQRPADNSSGALNDFKNLKITVGQTTNLIDQTIRVSYEGMAGTAGPDGTLRQASASNFLQIMQCWGPDPSAADFRNTCAFGAWASSGIDAAPAQQLTTAGAGAKVTERPDNVPYVASDGSRSVPDPSHSDNGVRKYFNATSGNEQDFVTVPTIAQGIGFTLFNAETAASAPWLGCGSPTSAGGAGNRCWLVVVPRGTHSGSINGDATKCASASVGDTGFGTRTAVQVGSPLSTDCSFWDDRMVVPLDFLPVASHCKVGAAEVNTNGSLLLNQAMHSWQQSLCAVGGETYTIANNSGALTRAQILDGSVGLGFLGLPVTAADDDSGELWSSADVRYGPVANAALTIGYIAEDRLGNQVTNLKLTPRLVAKLLTQSYQRQVPLDDHTGQATVPQLDKNPSNIGSDQEFQRLNPGVVPLGIFVSKDVGFIETGPQGDDALQLLWSWIEADNSARTWLSGTPDEYGMVVNPYYLPSSNPKAIGGGLGGTDLSTGPVDQIFRNDPTALTPPDAAGAAIKLDSTSLSPFARNFADAASRIARGDTQHGQDNLVPGALQPTLLVDPPRVVGADNKDIMGITDGASAALYGLGTAELQLPNEPSTFVAPTLDSMSAAIAAQKPVTGGKPASTTTSIDFSSLPKTAYPLTMTIYAAVNIDNTALDDGTRAEYTALLNYAVGDGQTPGTATGQLPEGYAPLGSDQVAETKQLIDILSGKLDPNPTSSSDAAPSDGGSPSSDGASTGFVPSTDDVPVATSASASIPVSSVGTSNTALDVVTPVSAQKQSASRTAVGQAALAGSLGVGVAGMVAAPLLMRRKVIAP